MPLRHGISLVMSAVCALTAVSVRAQVADTVRGVVRPSCRVQLRRRVTLGGDNVPAISEMIRSLSRDRRGRYFTPARGPNNAPPQHALAFDSGGRFISTFARNGNGPGEVHRAFRVLAARGDSIYIADFPSGRIALYSPDLKPVTTLQGMDGQIADLVQLPDGSLLEAFGSLGGLGPYARWSLTRVPRNGSAESFMRTTLVLGGVMDSWRRIARPTANGVWTVQMLEYVLEHWSLTGERTEVLVRAAPWFIAHHDPPTPREHAAAIRAVHEDALGRLWLLVFVPSDCTAGFDQFGQCRAGVTRVEVIDPRRRRVLASGIASAELSEFMGDGQVAGLRMDEDGSYVYDVYDLSLTGSSFTGSPR